MDEENLALSGADITTDAIDAAASAAAFGRLPNPNPTPITNPKAAAAIQAEVKENNATALASCILEQKENEVKERTLTTSAAKLTYTNNNKNNSSQQQHEQQAQQQLPSTNVAAAAAARLHPNNDQVTTMKNTTNAAGSHNLSTASSSSLFDMSLWHDLCRTCGKPSVDLVSLFTTSEKVKENMQVEEKQMPPAANIPVNHKSTMLHTTPIQQTQEATEQKSSNTENPMPSSSSAAATTTTTTTSTTSKSSKTTSTSIDSSAAATATSIASHDQNSTFMDAILQEMQIWNLRIRPNDGYPQQICAKCRSQFSLVSKFRRKCLKVQIRLRAMHADLKLEHQRDKKELQEHSERQQLQASEQQNFLNYAKPLRIITTTPPTTTTGSISTSKISSASLLMPATTTSSSLTPIFKTTRLSASLSDIGKGLINDKQNVEAPNLLKPATQPIGSTSSLLRQSFMSLSAASSNDDLSSFNADWCIDGEALLAKHVIYKTNNNNTNIAFKNIAKQQEKEKSVKKEQSTITTICHPKHLKHIANSGNQKLSAPILEGAVSWHQNLNASTLATKKLKISKSNATTTEIVKAQTNFANSQQYCDDEHKTNLFLNPNHSPIFITKAALKEYDYISPNTSTNSSPVKKKQLKHKLGPLSFMLKEQPQNVESSDAANNKHHQHYHHHYLRHRQRHSDYLNDEHTLSLETKNKLKQLRSMQQEMQIMPKMTIKPCQVRLRALPVELLEAIKKQTWRQPTSPTINANAKGLNVKELVARDVNNINTSKNSTESSYPQLNNEEQRNYENLMKPTPKLTATHSSEDDDDDGDDDDDYDDDEENDDDDDADDEDDNEENENTTKENKIKFENNSKSNVFKQTDKHATLLNYNSNKSFDMQMEHDGSDYDNDNEVYMEKGVSENVVQSASISDLNNTTNTAETQFESNPTSPGQVKLIFERKRGASYKSINEKMQANLNELPFKRMKGRPKRRNTIESISTGYVEPINAENSCRTRSQSREQIRKAEAEKEMEKEKERVKEKEAEKQSNELDSETLNGCEVKQGVKEAQQGVLTFETEIQNVIEKQDEILKVIKQQQEIGTSNELIQIENEMNSKEQQTIKLTDKNETIENAKRKLKAESSEDEDEVMSAKQADSKLAQQKRLKLVAPTYSDMIEEKEKVCLNKEFNLKSTKCDKNLEEEILKNKTQTQTKLIEETHNNSTKPEQSTSTPRRIIRRRNSLPAIYNKRDFFRDRDFSTSSHKRDKKGLLVRIPFSFLTHDFKKRHLPYLLKDYQTDRDKERAENMTNAKTSEENKILQINETIVDKEQETIIEKEADETVTVDKQNIGENSTTTLQVEFSQEKTDESTEREDETTELQQQEEQTISSNSSVSFKNVTNQETQDKINISSENIIKHCNTETSQVITVAEKNNLEYTPYVQQRSNSFKDILADIHATERIHRQNIEKQQKQIEVFEAINKKEELETFKESLEPIVQHNEIIFTGMQAVNTEENMDTKITNEIDNLIEKQQQTEEDFQNKINEDTNLVVNLFQDIQANQNVDSREETYQLIEEVVSPPNSLMNRSEISLECEQLQETANTIKETSIAETFQTSEEVSESPASLLSNVAQFPQTILEKAESSKLTPTEIISKPAIVTLTENSIKTFFANTTPPIANNNPLNFTSKINDFINEFQTHCINTSDMESRSTTPNPPTYAIATTNATTTSNMLSQPCTPMIVDDVSAPQKNQTITSRTNQDEIDDVETTLNGILNEMQDQHIYTPVSTHTDDFFSQSVYSPFSDAPDTPFYADSPATNYGGGNSSGPGSCFTEASSPYMLHHHGNQQMSANMVYEQQNYAMTNCAEKNMPLIDENSTIQPELIGFQNDMPCFEKIEMTNKNNMQNINTIEVGNNAPSGVVNTPAAIANKESQNDNAIFIAGADNSKEYALRQFLEDFEATERKQLELPTESTMNAGAADLTDNLVENATNNETLVKTEAAKWPEVSKDLTAPLDNTVNEQVEAITNAVTPTYYVNTSSNLYANTNLKNQPQVVSKPNKSNKANEHILPNVQLQQPVNHTSQTVSNPQSQLQIQQQQQQIMIVIPPDYLQNGSNSQPNVHQTYTTNKNNNNIKSTPEAIPPQQQQKPQQQKQRRMLLPKRQQQQQQQQQGHIAHSVLTHTQPPQQPIKQQVLIAAPQIQAMNRGTSYMLTSSPILSQMAMPTNRVQYFQTASGLIAAPTAALHTSNLQVLPNATGVFIRTPHQIAHSTAIQQHIQQQQQQQHQQQQQLQQQQQIQAQVQTQLQLLSQPVQQTQQRQNQPPSNPLQARLEQQNNNRSVNLTCRFCHKAIRFTNNLDYSNHIIAFHPENMPYNCPSCPANFVRRTQRQQHILDVHGVKRFQCAQCGDSFSSQRALDSHLQRAHAPEGQAQKSKPQFRLADRSNVNNGGAGSAFSVGQQLAPWRDSSANMSSSMATAASSAASSPTGLVRVEDVHLQVSDERNIDGVSSINPSIDIEMDNNIAASPTPMPTETKACRPRKLCCPDCDESSDTPCNHDAIDEFLDPEASNQDSMKYIKTELPSQQLQYNQNQQTQLSHLSLHVTMPSPEQTEPDSTTKLRRYRRRRYNSSRLTNTTTFESTLTEDDGNVEGNGNGDLNQQRAILTAPRLLRNSHNCLFCQENFTNEIALRKHHQLAHGNLATMPYICTICKRGYRMRTALQRHMETHAIEGRPFECDECHVRFPRSSHLTLHKLTVHAMLKPHACKECGKQFGTESTLKTHMKFHGEKKISCDLCDRRFFLMKDMRKHRRSVHLGVHFYKCDICSSSFLHHSRFTAHQKTHMTFGVYHDESSNSSNVLANNNNSISDNKNNLSVFNNNKIKNTGLSYEQSCNIESSITQVINDSSKLAAEQVSQQNETETVSVDQSIEQQPTQLQGTSMPLITSSLSPFCIDK